MKKTIVASMLIFGFLNIAVAVDSKRAGRTAKTSNAKPSVPPALLFEAGKDVDVQIDETNHMGLAWHQDFKIVQGKLSSAKLSELKLSNEDIAKLNQISQALMPFRQQCAAGKFSVTVTQVASKKNRIVSGCLEDKEYKAFHRQLLDWKVY